MVFWTRRAPPEFLARLIVSMGCSTHAPGETIPSNRGNTSTMYVLQKGTAWVGKRMVQFSSRKTVWNDDFFLANSDLKKSINAKAITYAQVHYLAADVLHSAIGEAGADEEMAQMKIDMMWIMLLRGMQFTNAHDGHLPSEWVEIRKAKGRSNTYGASMWNRRQMRSEDDIVATPVEPSSITSGPAVSGPAVSGAVGVDISVILGLVQSLAQQQKDLSRNQIKIMESLGMT